MSSRSQYNYYSFEYSLLKDQEYSEDHSVQSQPYINSLRAVRNEDQLPNSKFLSSAQSIYCFQHINRFNFLIMQQIVLLLFIVTYLLFVKKEILKETECKFIAETLKGAIVYRSKPSQSLKKKKKRFLIAQSLSKQMSKYQSLHFPD